MLQPKAGDITKAFDYEVDLIRDFVAEVLEDANDHGTALAIWSHNMGDVDLACDFLRLSSDVEEAGELTDPLRDRQATLLARFRELKREQGDNPDDEDEGDGEDNDEGED